MIPQGFGVIALYIIGMFGITNFQFHDNLLIGPL
jgi:hypothetical protein